MSSLAQILIDDGNEVVGSDIVNFVYTQDALIKNGVNILSLQDKSYLHDYFVIIGHNFYEPILIDELRSNNVNFMEYHKFLAYYLNNKKEKLVSISGSHGKTTLTGMLNTAIKESSCLRGDGYGRKIKDGKYFFLESCEYKDHFLVYEPEFIIITNIDYDHVDYFLNENQYIESFKNFSLNGKRGLIDFESAYKINNKNFYTYGLNNNADFFADDYQADEKGIRGKIYYKDKLIVEFHYTHLFGLPLLKDVIATFAFAYLNNENLTEIKNNINNFVMANKRFNVNQIDDNNVFINDYAHHPTQIEENYKTIKNMFPGYKYIAIFKPDRVSRLDYFKDDFIRAFKLFDIAYLIDNQSDNFIDILKTMESSNTMLLNNKNIGYVNANERNVFIFMSSKNLNETIDLFKKYIYK